MTAQASGPRPGGGAIAHFVEKWFQREPEMRIAASFCARADAPPGGDLAADELFVSEAGYRTYRRDGWKSAFDRQRDRVVLLDLRGDPHEQRDLASTRPDVVAAHRARLDALTRELAARGDFRAALSPDERARLEALGYLEPPGAAVGP